MTPYQFASDSTSTLTVGSHSVTAVYGGDANNAGSTSAVLTQTVSPSDFTPSANPSSATIPSGQPATYTVTVTPQGSFTSQISFACSGLPLLATSTFSPSTLTPNTNTVTTTLTIATGLHSAGSNPYTPAGTSQVVVTASAPASASGSNVAVSHTTTVTLIVQ